MRWRTMRRLGQSSQDSKPVMRMHALPAPTNGGLSPSYHSGDAPWQTPTSARNTQATWTQQKIRWRHLRTIDDSRGLALSGATAASLPRFEAAVRQLNLYIDNPVATVDQALAESPEFVMAHALRAWLHLIGTEPAGVQIARGTLAAAQKLPATDREQGHLTAIGHLVEGRWSATSRSEERRVGKECR